MMSIKIKRWLTVLLMTGLVPVVIASHARAADPLVLTPIKTGHLDWQTNNNSIRGHGGVRVGDYPGSAPDGYAPSIKAGYALWDLSSVTEPIASGNFRSTLLNPSPFGWYAEGANDSASESVAIRDVGTDLDVLQGLRTDGFFILGGDTSPFTPRQVVEDLLSGLSYGSAVATPGDVGQVFSITLDWRGIQDVNTAAGTVMGMGFQPTSGPRELLSFGSPQLVLNPFNAPVEGGAGVDFRLDDAEITTDGTIDLTDRGVRHRMSAYAVDQQTRDEKFSEVRRRFTFLSAAGSLPQTIRLTGDLKGTLAAGDALAWASATMELYRADGTLLDQTGYEESVVSTLLGDSRSSAVDERMVLTAELNPGEIYEVVSRLELLAELDGPLGSAEAFFADTFEVELTGVPEPATIGLLLVGGALFCLPRRLASRANRALQWSFRTSSSRFCGGV